MEILAGIKKLVGVSERRATVAELLAAVREAYSTAATNPEQPLPFPVGKSFAEGVGYPRTVLDSLPLEAVSSFAGVGQVGALAEIAPGSVVLDLGCGAGLDSLLAAGKTGPYGRVMGLDFSHAMVAKAIAASRRAGVSTILFCCGDAGRLPLATATVDVVLVNGIFNLNPERQGLFREMARVLKPGGTAYAAELVFTREQRVKGKPDLNGWLN